MDRNRKAITIRRNVRVIYLGGFAWPLLRERKKPSLPSKRLDQIFKCSSPIQYCFLYIVQYNIEVGPRWISVKIYGLLFFFASPLQLRTVFFISSKVSIVIILVMLITANCPRISNFLLLGKKETTEEINYLYKKIQKFALKFTRIKLTINFKQQ